MIKISIPSNNIPERKYILDIFFNEFLGLDYQIVENIDFESWGIELENGSRLIIEDHFFNKYPTELNYLKLENIPSKVEYVENEFTPEDDIPIIYGNSKLELQNDKIICGIDIFASSFFMLTRWEEYVNKNRDSHDRFPAYESLAYKQGFLERPIVNEYIEMLWEMLLLLGQTQKRKKREYRVRPTHDIDKPYKFPNVLKTITELIGDLVKRRSIHAFFLNVKAFCNYTINNYDPYITYNYLMDLSEKYQLTSHFYILYSQNSKYDGNYRLSKNKMKDIILNIQKRGHHIGIHYSYNSYLERELLWNEKKYLEKQFNIKINSGRNHYLRFRTPDSWQVYNNSGIEIDSTVGFVERIGFRSGTCYNYNTFNVLTSKVLNLKENPLLIMDSSYFVYNQGSISKDEFMAKCFKIVDIVRRYRGELVILWHNSTFFDFNDTITYEKLLHYSHTIETSND